MVVAHVSAFTPFNMILEANADIITHAPRDKSVTKEIATLMVQKRVVSVPILTMMQAVSARPPLSAALGMIIFQPSLFMAILRAKNNGQGGQTYKNTKDSVTRMNCAGLPILPRTDCHEVLSLMSSTENVSIGNWTSSSGQLRLC